MTTQATARLAKELKDLTKDPVGGFKVELPDESNIFEWHVFIQGPPDSFYEGGTFRAQMNFPDDYPNSPPKLKFLSSFWHPNVYADGGVCISILHTPDPMNPEEKAEECWRPIQTVESILVSVVSMLSDPNFSSPANVDASVELRKAPDTYRKRVRELVKKSETELPHGFEMPKPRQKVIVQNDDDFDFDEDDYSEEDFGSDQEDMEDEEDFEEDDS